MVGRNQLAGWAVLACAFIAVACGGKQTSAPMRNEAGQDPGVSGSGQVKGGDTSSGSAGTSTGGVGATAGAAVAGSSTGGAAGAGGAAAGAAGGPVIVESSGLRSGPFKMLVYSRTLGFRHDGSITSGQLMLQQIAAEQGFEVVLAESNELITPEGLRQFEIVFFLNTSGDVFNETEQQVYEDWMTKRQGAFGGVHGATNTENGWAFYSEVTGQYDNGHGPQGVPDNIVFSAGALNHPAVKGLPNPWPRTEEWPKFDNYQEWTQKPGFQVLGIKSADGQPITWIREFGNFRSFYTGLGHDASVFQDDDAVRQHITGGIMWAVRREHLIK